jgi:protein MpaA
MQVIKTISTKNNNEVQLISVEPHSYTKTLLVVGVVHGDEWQGEKIVDEMMKLSHKNRVLYIPCLNPDGVDLMTRTNANGVDINRNFPAKNWKLLPKDRYFGGDEPLSEIESKFLKEIIDEYKPDAILTLHTPFEVVNYDGPAKEIAQKMAELSGYRLEESIGYETPGSFGSYFGLEKGYPIITLEMKEIDDCQQLWSELKESLEYFIGI